MISFSSIVHTRRRMRILPIKVSGPIHDINNSSRVGKTSGNCYRIAMNRIYLNVIFGVILAKSELKGE
jgi:hypothetical protein